MDKNDIMRKALETYGNHAQTIVCIEELSELTKELSKELRGIGNVEHVAEEIADALITIEQMVMCRGIENRVEKWRTYKLDRLARGMGIKD